MLSRKIKNILILTVWGLFSCAWVASAQEQGVATVGASSLPINVSNQEDSVDAKVSTIDTALLSPSAAQSVPGAEQAKQEDTVAQPVTESESTTNSDKADNTPATQNQDNDDFNFDLRMKAISTPSVEMPQVALPNSSNEDAPSVVKPSEPDLAKEVSFSNNPADNLGNSILSQMDDDLFTQMSEIEKSTTLLTLELRREKIRNEIEAQKAIRIRNAEELQKQKAEEKLRSLEREKEIEATVLKEKQILLDKEKVFEALKQRKLLNAYMNQMLLEKQEWLREKEALYAKLADAEKERKELIDLFKIKISKILTASAKNIQTAEAAKANFDRIVKGLKARNEQLRKRIEADAQIIKNSKSSLYQKAQSIEELKGKKVNMSGGIAAAVPQEPVEEEIPEEEDTESTDKLSAQYAILGIAGRAGVMSVELIDAQGIPLSLKSGSSLPTGHVVSEIGSDYVKFTKDGHDDYLYVGRTIDGVVPTLGLTKDKAN